MAFACAFLVPGGEDKSWGATVSLEQASLLAENWLTATTPPIRQGALGRRLRESIPCLKDGRPLFYIFNLAPQGWLVVGGDTRQEPIMAFGEGSLSPDVLEDKAFMALFFHVPPQGCTPRSPFRIAFVHSIRRSGCPDEPQRRKMETFVEKAPCY